MALDRFDRRKIMIASDLVRSVIALAFILILRSAQRWLLYLLSGAADVRLALLHQRTIGRPAAHHTPDELHTANALTQTTGWLTLSIGTLLGGMSTMRFGYEWAFVVNAAFFRLQRLGHLELRNRRRAISGRSGSWSSHHGLRELSQGSEREAWPTCAPLRWSWPIGMAYVGWASGGGAAQVLFTLFGELVFQRGSAGIGIIWSAAGFGLVIGGILAHRLGKRLTFRGYKNAISIGYFIHGASLHLLRGDADHLAVVAVHRDLPHRHGLEQRPQPDHAPDPRTRPTSRTHLLHHGDDAERA